MTRDELQEQIKLQLLKLFEEEKIESQKLIADSVQVIQDPNDPNAYQVSYSVPIRGLHFDIVVDNKDILPEE